MRTVRLALAQLNTTVGDFAGNLDRIRRAIARAESLGAELIAFPEQTIPGYPAEDLLLRSEFIAANLAALETLAREVKNSVVVVGFADRKDDVFNAAAVLEGSQVRGVYHKHHLPNYSVFDEKRYFQAGREALVFGFGPITFGVNVCEDMWYPDGPAVAQAGEGGAELLLCLSASPYFRGKAQSRERMLATRAADNVAVVAFVNQVGGQDELVFDGSSVIIDPNGETIARAHPRRRDGLAPGVALADALPVRRIELARRERPAGRRRPRITPGLAPHLEGTTELYAALVRGLTDYVEKNRFGRVVLGLSGGIDSSVTAAIAVDALGPKRVVGVSMPSRYTAKQSEHDAAELARRLGIEMFTVPIGGIVTAYEEALAPAFKGLRADATEENLQARARGNTLMALSNKFGWMVLTTGNKSEVSVGFCTLYGDTAGGFAILKDVPKTSVYALARHRNERARVAGDAPPIPESTLTRPPTPELRPGQRTEDSLPPYAVLDPLLEAYVEEDASPEDLVERGFLPDMVRQVVGMVDGNEYKRRQSPPGLKVTPRAFGRDRRLPISQVFGGAGRKKAKAPKARARRVRGG
jgi:NAD+ synthase (glutamine-hydrolysing)